LTAADTATWVRVIALEELPVERGVCALIGSWQIALFRIATTGEVFALSNLDPFSGASVLSRGIVGTRGDIPKVASPVYKQNFDLRSGRCLDDADVSVPRFAVRVVNGAVEVAVPGYHP
jgi:nitrite reductase (NADH) small subunit